MVGIMEGMWIHAKRKNDRNILKLLDKDPKAQLLDLGCDDGVWTRKLARKIGSKNYHGIEINPEAIPHARKRGVVVKKSDLNNKLPYKDKTFDVIHANQVIEHLANIDNFVSEIKRVLKKGGCAIISTENLSAWDNILALLFGQQAFSQHISGRYHVGNKFSPHYGKRIRLESWSHKIIFTYYGIQQLFKAYGFKIEDMKTAGHFPFPSFFDYIDPVHSHFITIKVRK